MPTTLLNADPRRSDRPERVRPLTGAPIVETIGPTVDALADGHDVVAVGYGVEIAFSPLGERRLERMLCREDELGMTLEVHTALLAHARVARSATKRRYRS
jgi:hypothetical protein